MAGSNRIQRIMETFKDVPVVKKGDYRYFVHPLSDGIPSIDPNLLEDAAPLLSEIASSMGEFDLLLTAESMGIPVTTAISLETGHRFSIARKRRYGLEGEIEVSQRTGYSSSNLFLNLPASSGSLLIVDDVLSTGGTLRSLKEGAERSGWSVAGAVILFNKMGAGQSDLSRDLGFPIRSLLEVEVDMHGCRITRSPDRS